MNKYITFLLLVAAIGVKAQTTPVTTPPANPQLMNTNTIYQDAITKKIYSYNGTTFLWHQLTDSIQVDRMLTSKSAVRDSTIAPNIDGGFILSRNNPTNYYGVESTLLQQPGLNVLDMWFRSTAGTQDTVKYAHTINADLDKYNTPVVCYIDGVIFRGFFPYVRRVNSHYIMAFTQGGYLYMATSTDKVHWFKINGGAAVMRPSTDPNSTTYYLYNPAFELVGNTYHLIIEGETSNAGPNVGSNFNLSYSYSDTTTLNFNTHLSSTYVIRNAGNADIHYIPSKNAFLLLYGSVSETISDTWDIKAATANLSAGLSDSTKWTLAPQFTTLRQIGVPISDPSLVEVTGVSNNKLILGLNYNQLSLYQAYNYSYSMLDFYNLITKPYVYSGFSTTGQINAQEITIRGSLFNGGNGTYGNGYTSTRQVFNPSDQYAVALRNGTIPGFGYVGVTRGHFPDIVFSNEAGTEMARFLQLGGMQLKGSSTIIRFTDTFGTPQEFTMGVDYAGTGDRQFYISNTNILKAALRFSGTNNDATFGSAVNLDAPSGSNLAFKTAGAYTTSMGNHLAVTGGGSSTDFNIYINGTNPFTLYTNNINRFSIDGSTGFANFSGGLTANSISTLPVTYAGLPALQEGIIKTITDSNTNTWGAIITGGGTNHVLAYCNGVNWTVVGK